MSGYTFQSLLGDENIDVDTIVVDEIDASTVHVSKYLFVDAPAQAIINELVIPTSAHLGYVLTSDANGYASWQPSASITLAGDAIGAPSANRVDTLAGGTIAVTSLVDKTSSQILTNKTITGTFTGSLTGNASTATLAATVTTNANLTGDITS